MLIKRIELRYIKMELVAPFVTSMGVETHEEHIIIRVESDGVTGGANVLLREILSIHTRR